jgi:hypothetical protein
MNYLECKKQLQMLNDSIFRRIENDLSDKIAEIFIASTNYYEMVDELINIYKNGCYHSKVIPKSSENDYSIYIMTKNNFCDKIDLKKYFE